MPRRGAEREARRANHRGDPHGARAAKRQEPDDRKPEAGEPDLALKRAVGPANERGRDVTEEHVHHEVHEVREPDREQAEVRERHTRGRSDGARAWQPRDRDGSDDKSGGGQRQSEVFEQASDDDFHCVEP